MSDGDVERNIFVNLKIIGKIRTHERIATRGGYGMSIESNDKIQCLRRWYYGETRDHNIDCVSTLLDAAFNQLKLRLDKDDLNDDDTRFVNRLHMEFKNTRNGLQNLATTYASCSVSSARIEHLIDLLERHTNASEIS